MSPCPLRYPDHRARLSALQRGGEPGAARLRLRPGRPRGRRTRARRRRICPAPTTCTSTATCRAPRPARNGRHPLPERQRAGASVSAPGASPRACRWSATTPRAAPYAARAWWLLRWIGHDAVAVLDGGLAAWRDAGDAHDRWPRAVPAPRRPIPPGRAAMPTIDADTPAGQPRPAAACVDARAGERFRGEIEPLDAVAGHIPGALNRFFKDNLEADGRFKPVARCAPSGRRCWA